MTRARSAGNGNESAPERTPSEHQDAAVLASYDAKDVRRFAHAIRNPLNGAKLHLVFLQREIEKLGASDDAIESARVIGEEIDRVASLVTELVETPRPAARPRTLVSLRSLCARAIDLLSSNAREVGVDVGAELEDPDLLLEVQRQEMEQVLFDLLHRALQGALAGGGRVVLRAHRDEEAGQAAIEIQHDGRGSSPGLGPLIESHSGSDFSVAMRIVADHGGTIELVTRPGQASFHVRLPLSGVDDAANAAELG